MHRTLAVSTIALAAASGAATVARADPWSVLVIGSGGEAIATSSALSTAGVADVRHLMEGGARDIVDAVGGMAGAERVMIYYEGALASRAGQPAIGDDPRLTMAALVDRLAAEGASEIALLVENCTTDAGAEIAPPVGTLRGDVLLAASAGPGQACDGPALSDALTGAALDTPLEQIVSASWVGVSPQGSFSLDPGAGAPSTSVAFLEARPEGTTVAAPPPGGEVQTALFVAPPASQIAAIPVAAGMPQPSIIVGIIQTEPETTEVAAVLGGTEVEADAVEGIGDITYDNLEARVAMRSEQPEVFAQLVEGGAFDPPEVELAVALQTELARMDCYTMAIDGAFGPGSQRAVGRYFDERDDADRPDSFEASVELFRQIILHEDVTCPPPPAPVATAAPRSSSSSSSSSASSAPARSAPAPTPAPAPAPAPQSSGSRSISTTGGIGVFR